MTSEQINFFLDLAAAFSALFGLVCGSCFWVWLFGKFGR